MGEIWRDINGYEGKYQVSNFGNIRNSKLLILKKGIKGRGYNYVNLYKNSKPKKHYVHRLVAQAFIPNPHHLPEVNHKDEVKFNNHVHNLEWCTSKYNANYGKRSMIIGNSRKKAIIQYDMDGNKIKEWDSASDVNYKDCHFRGISACATGRQKSHRGYIWRYADEEVN